MAEGNGDTKGQSAKGQRNARTRLDAKRGGSSGANAGAEGAESMDPERDARALRELRASNKRYYRIGEVSRLTSVKPHVLRYWETEFRWMSPPKSRSRQRLYRKRDIELVWLLKRLLWGERYTIAGARQRIQELGVDQALALLDLPLGAAAPSVAAPEEAAEVSGGPDWTALRSALDAMKGDLLGVREALQEGL
jgi:DNA-binding transcriptional MerR regulator